MSAHECIVAKFQTFIQQLPELFFVAVGNNANLRKVQTYYALIETSFKLILSVFVFPRRKEAAASHRAEYIAFIIFTHFLCGNVIRIHSLCRAFNRHFSYKVIFSALEAIPFIKHINELRESRSNIHAFFVFNAFISLTEYLLNYHSVFFRIFIVFSEIHEEQSYERRLSVGSHQSIYLILDSLHT